MPTRLPSVSRDVVFLRDEANTAGEPLLLDSDGNVSGKALRMRDGTLTELETYVPKDGEIVVERDAEGTPIGVRIGDGTTPGGVPFGSTSETNLIAKFNAGVEGNLASYFVFTRDADTVDSDGSALSEDLPRYDQYGGVFDHVADDRTLSYSLPVANIHAVGGYDSDGTTPLLWVSNPTANSLLVFRGTLTAPVTTNLGRNGANWDLNNGADPLYRYVPVAGTICHGLIVCHCVRYLVSSGAKEGIGILYSQDLGATFDVLLDTEGNGTLPTRVSGQGRGTGFCLQNWWPETDGQDPPLAAWFAFTDYELRNSPSEATGGQTGLFRATRASIDDDWVVDTCRLVYSLETEAGVHFHSAFPCIDLANNRGWVVTSVGDTTDRNHTHLTSFALSTATDYKTAILTQNATYFGAQGTGTGVDNGTFGSQFTGCAPGPTHNTALVGADFTREVISRFDPPAVADDLSTVKAKIARVYGANRLVENFSVVCRDPVNRRGWLSGGSSAFAAGTINELYYSDDGVNWTEVYYRGTSGTSPYPAFFGDLIVDVASTLGLYTIPTPTAFARRPLLVGPGTLNRVGAMSQWTAPEAGITWTKQTPNGDGLYEFPSGHPREGEVLPEQPQSLTEVWRITGSGLNDNGGLRYMSATEYPTHSETNGGSVWALFPLVDGLTVLVSTSQTGTETAAVTGTENWAYLNYHGDRLLRVNTQGRPAGNIFLRDGADSCPHDMLVCMVGHAPNGGGFSVGYPVAPGADKSAVHELAKFASVPVRPLWSVKASFGIPRLGLSGPASTPLLTIKRDADNYVLVSWTANDELTLSVVADGASAVTDTCTVILREVPDRSFRVVVSTLADGTTELLATSGGSVMATATVATSITATTLDLLLAANADQSLIGCLRVYGVSVRSDLSSAERTALLESAKD